MISLNARKTGQIICGGGVIKHHICNANLMRNGADFSVYINTGSELEASDTGASPDEAKSWGKIKASANPVKVWGDFTIILPLLVSQTFAKAVFAPLSPHHHRPALWLKEEKEMREALALHASGSITSTAPSKDSPNESEEKPSN